MYGGLLRSTDDQSRKSSLLGAQTAYQWQWLFSEAECTWLAKHPFDLREWNYESIKKIKIKGKKKKIGANDSSLQWQRRVNHAWTLGLQRSGSNSRGRGICQVALTPRFLAFAPLAGSAPTSLPPRVPKRFSSLTRERRECIRPRHSIRIGQSWF